MTTLAVTVFAGEVPRIAPRLLESQQAAQAVNCDVTQGLLRPLRSPGRVQALPAPAQTIFKHAVDGWLSWPDRVDVVKSAIFDADGERPLGQLLMTGARDYPTMYLAGGEVFRLGIPRPDAVLAVTTATGAALRNVEAVAFASDDLESAPGRENFAGAEILGEDDVTLTVSASLAASRGPVVTQDDDDEDAGCADLSFDRAACLAAKVLQLNDAAVPPAAARPGMSIMPEAKPASRRWFVPPPTATPWCSVWPTDSSPMKARRRLRLKSLTC